MIYLDQAATSFPKPPAVAQAVCSALAMLGNSGRAGHNLSLAASRLGLENIQSIEEKLTRHFYNEVRKIDRIEIYGDFSNTDRCPLLHEALGTTEQGAVRFSFSHLNTIEELNTALQALGEISERFESR